MIYKTSNNTASFDPAGGISLLCIPSPIFKPDLAYHFTTFPVSKPWAIQEMSSTAATDKMLLFDLPAELVSKILVHAVLARGIKRALRLRLVCSLSCSSQPRHCN